MPERISLLALTVLAAIFLAGITSAFIINSDFGKLDVEIVEIPDGDHYVSGLLYRPRTATTGKPLPAVVLVHGISSAKESMSSIALELARRDFVALTIDVVGHGDSGGRLGATGDFSLGTLAAIRYLEAQPYVNASSLGLVGHSLGAGAIRAAAFSHGRIKATVFIAGGLGEMASDPSAYGVLNSTFPKNLLVVIGRQDVLFELPRVMGEILPPVFGVSQGIVPERPYGNFSSGTARKLITPVTTHLLEPLDPNVVSETVVWMSNALKLGESGQVERLEGSLIYPYREAIMLLSVLIFVGLIFPISICMLPNGFKSVREKSGFLPDWIIMVLWGVLSMILFLPTFFLSFIISFPPVLFGSSIAWWLLMVGITGLFILFILSKFSNIRLRMRTMMAESFMPRKVFVAICLFLLLYFIVHLMNLFLNFNLWIFVPIFKALKSPARVILFLTFIPFFLIFFYVEGIYLHILRRKSEKKGLLAEALDMGRTIGIKIAPYMTIMSIQYIPMFLLEFKPLTSFIGFMLEFFPLITLQFIISTACSWWFHRFSSSISMGAIFNALLFAWISAGVFPFGVFR